LIDFDGKNILLHHIQDRVSSNRSKQILGLNLNAINFDKKTTVLVIESDKQSWLHYFSKPKDLKLKSQTIQKTITKTNQGFEIVLSSKTLQKDVFLFCNEKGHFSDNYFDLLPNEVKRITFKTKATSLADLKIKTLNAF